MSKEDSKHEGKSFEQILNNEFSHGESHTVSTVHEHSISPVPEPHTAWMLVAGLLMVATIMWIRKKRD